MNQEPRELIIGINDIETLMKYGEVNFETGPIRSNFRLEIGMMLKIISHSESRFCDKKRIAKVLDFTEKEHSTLISLKLQDFKSN